MCKCVCVVRCVCVRERAVYVWAVWVSCVCVWVCQ